MTGHRELVKVDVSAHHVSREACFWHGLAEIPGVDKQEAQNTLETVMAVLAGKTLTTKKMHFSQAPVGSRFCELFLLFTVLTVLTELKGTSSLPSSSRFIYSSCLFLSLFLRNYTDILTPVLLVNNTQWFRCYPRDAALSHSLCLCLSVCHDFCPTLPLK